MAEDILQQIVNTDVDENVCSWFLGLFDKPNKSCTIEEFAVFYLNFVRNQVEQYTKGTSSACNTPRKHQELFLGDATPNEKTPAGRVIQTTTTATRAATSSSTVNVSRDLFASGRKDLLNASTSTALPLTPCKDVVAESTPTTSTPIQSKAIHSESLASVKNASNFSVGTPNRSSNSSRNSYSMRSQKSANDSRSFDTSALAQDSPMNASHRLAANEKSRERRGQNSPVCLSDFITNAMTPTGAVTGKVKRRRSVQTPNTPQDTAAVANSSTGSPAVTTPGSGSKPPHPQQLVNVMNRSSDKDFPAFTPKGKATRIVPTMLSSTSSPIASAASPKFNKPVKRVAPLTISRTGSEFTSSSFRADNNILELTHEEVDIRHDLLKTQKDAIRQAFMAEERAADSSKRTLLKEQLSLKLGANYPTQSIDLSKITSEKMLLRLVQIYSLILDLNLITNILNEIAFLVNLVSLETGPMIGAAAIVSHTTSANQQLIDTFRNVNNCVYFGIGVLKYQKHTLCLLDTTSMKALLENERLNKFEQTLKDDLCRAYAHKTQLRSQSIASHDTSFQIGQSMQVYYQQEHDTKMNFPSDQEFRAFKKQRDDFYAILDTWQTKQLSLTWNFEAELSRRVRALLEHMDHPINMAHLAKLFTSQLILSCNFSVAATDLPHIDPSKLNKLEQRFVALSHCSTKDQFSDQQMFFKDFILSTRNHTIFIEQLKITLTNELLDMNDSTYETLNLSTVAQASGVRPADTGSSAGVDNDDDTDADREYVVKPETLSTLSVLAKFLGFVVALPFTYEYGRNAVVDNQQVLLRNKMCPAIDVEDILRKSLVNQKLVVTLPWIVQYISMLDAVTLRLDYYRGVFEMLYELYAMFTSHQQHQQQQLPIRRPTSVFILRTCLGWLFDQPNVPNDYYHYRQNRKPLKEFNRSVNGNSMTVAEIWIPKDIQQQFTASNATTILLPNDRSENGQILNYVLQQQPPTASGSADQHQALVPCTMATSSSALNLNQFDPLLENILIAACPFLADFRVSIMSRKISKSVSRTGRYRRVTATLYESPLPATRVALPKSDDDPQARLTNAFLQSQSLSVRRTVELVLERVVSAVIKDFQVEHFIPIKRDVKFQVDALCTVDGGEGNQQQIEQNLYAIYTNGEQQMVTKWNEVLPTMIKDRVQKAFDALLPNETNAAVRSACINIVVRKCRIKAEEWKTKNLIGIDVFTKDINEDIERIVKGRIAHAQILENTFEIELEAVPPWQAIEALQQQLHIASSKPTEIRADAVLATVRCVTEAVRAHTLPTTMYRINGSMVLQLLMLVIVNRHEIVTAALIDACIAVWQCRQLSLFVNVPSDNAPETIIVDIDKEQWERRKTHPSTCYLFGDLLAPVFVHSLQLKSKQCWEALGRLIIQLVKVNLMTIGYLTDVCVKLLRHEWPQVSFVIGYTARHCRYLTTNI